MTGRITTSDPTNANGIVVMTRIPSSRKPYSGEIPINAENAIGAQATTRIFKKLLEKILAIYSRSRNIMTNATAIEKIKNIY